MSKIVMDIVMGIGLAWLWSVIGLESLCCSLDQSGTSLIKIECGVEPFAYFQLFRLFASFFLELSLAFCYVSFIRAVSNWVSKVMLGCFGFALLRYVIGPGNSRHNLNQSNVNLKPITTWSLAFSRSLCFTCHENTRALRFNVVSNGEISAETRPSA